MLSSDVLMKQPIVIDQGSSVTKAGFAGSERPKFASVPSLIGLPTFVLNLHTLLEWFFVPIMAYPSTSKSFQAVLWRIQLSLAAF